MTLADRLLRHVEQQGFGWTLRAAAVFVVRHPRRAAREVSRLAGRANPTFDAVEPGARLDLGCGMTPKPGYVGVDVHPPAGAIEHDLTEPFPIEPGVVEEIVCEHVVEHFDREDVVPFLDECCRILRSGGVMRVAVPDHGSPGSTRARERSADDHPDHRYVTTVETLAEDVAASDFSRMVPRHYWREGVFRYEPLDGPPPIRRTPDASDAPFAVAIENSSLVVDLFA